MPDETQMEYLIRKAQEKVARKGVPNDSDHVSDTDVILAGFGWLADQIRPSRAVIGNKTQASLIVSAVGVAVAAFSKAMGWF